MKHSDALGVILTAVEVVSVVAFIMGVYTMLGVFSTTMSSSNSQSFELKMSDPVIIPIRLTPQNAGFVLAERTVGLESEMKATVKLLDGENEVIAENSTVVILPPGSREEVWLELRIPLEDALVYLGEDSDVSWETEIEVKTLFNMISFQNKMQMEGTKD